MNQTSFLKKNLNMNTVTFEALTEIVTQAIVELKVIEERTQQLLKLNKLISSFSRPDNTYPELLITERGAIILIASSQKRPALADDLMDTEDSLISLAHTDIDVKRFSMFIINMALPSFIAFEEDCITYDTLLTALQLEEIAAKRY